MSNRQIFVFAAGMIGLTDLINAGLKNDRGIIVLDDNQAIEGINYDNVLIELKTLQENISPEAPKIEKTIPDWRSRGKRRMTRPK